MSEERRMIDMTEEQITAAWEEADAELAMENALGRIAELEEERGKLISSLVAMDEIAEENERLRDALTQLEAFVAAYDALAPAIHSGDNYRIARAIAATDEARQALGESGE